MQLGLGRGRANIALD